MNIKKSYTETTPKWRKRVERTWHSKPMRQNNWSQNQKILYNYDVSCLALLNETGTLSTTEPSPLSRDEIVSVLELIAQTDPYKKQTIICHDYKFDEVILKAGTIVPITEDS